MPLILVVEDFDDAREMYRDYLDTPGSGSSRLVTGTRPSSRRAPRSPI